MVERKKIYQLIVSVFFHSRCKRHQIPVHRLGILFSLIIALSSVHSQTRTLDDYLLAARKYNATLIDYQNQIASLDFDSSKILAAYVPKVNFTSAATIAPVIGGYGYDSAITNGAVYSALIGVSQDLFQGGNRDLQIAKLSTQRQSLATTLAINERELIKNITAQYVTVYSDQKAIESASESLSIADEQLKILSELVSRGVYNEIDHLNLKIARNQQDIALLQARTQFRTDLFKLNQLAGIDDTSYVTLTELQLKVNPSIPLRQSLRARQFTLDSLNIEYDRELLGWAYKPKLSWSADAGLNTTYLPTAYHNLGFSLGLSLTIPIYDGHQRYFEEEKFDLSQRTIEAQSRFFYIETNIQRLMLTEQLQAQDTAIAQYRKLLENISVLLGFDKEQLLKGNLKINDLLTVLNTLNTTRLSLRQAEIAQLGIIVELNNLNF
jgi:outer membrane protein TolC